MPFVTSFPLISACSGGLYPKKLVEAVDKVAVARDDFCAEFSTLLTKKVKKDVDISILAGQRLFKQ